MMLLKILFFTLLALPIHAFDVREEVEESQNQITVSAELSSFKLEKGSLESSGVKLDFAHFFNKHTAIEMYMSTAISGQGDVSNSFTGFGGYLNYVVYGECCTKSKNIFTNGSLTSTEITNASNRVMVGIGLDQYLLNGNRGVYSTSGPGVTASYTFILFNLSFKTSAKFTQMITDEEKVSGLFFTLGFNFNL